MQINENPLHMENKQTSKPILEEYIPGKKPKRGDPTSSIKDVLTEIIHKEGNWSESHRKLLIRTIHEAYKIYPEDMDKQLEFLHFNLEQDLGKRIQIVIYQNVVTEGHCLYAVDGKYLNIEYKGLCYLIWKVKLIEDVALENIY